jgi:hypothetical protein
MDSLKGPNIVVERPVIGKYDSIPEIERRFYVFTFLQHNLSCSDAKFKQE